MSPSATVLVCGDNPDSTEVLVRLLANAGFHVHRAASRSEITEWIMANPRQPVLVDASHGDGNDMLAVVADVDSASATSVLLITAPRTDDVPLHHPPHVAVLNRPVRANEIVQTIASMMGSGHRH